MHVIGAQIWTFLRFLDFEGARIWVERRSKVRFRPVRCLLPGAETVGLSRNLCKRFSAYMFESLLAPLAAGAD